VTGGKPIAVLLQSISDVSAINPVVLGRKERGAILLFCPGHHTLWVTFIRITKTRTLFLSLLMYSQQHIRLYTTLNRSYF
jgi:hypothetical protein